LANLQLGIRREKDKKMSENEEDKKIDPETSISPEKY
jgi:hypothetical protein